MFKPIINAFLLFILIFSLSYNMYQIKTKIFSFLKIEDNINKLIVANKNFDLFIQNNKRYDNFDIIQAKINHFIQIQKKIQNNDLLNINNESLRYSIKNLDKSIKIKFDLLNKIKAHRAILNNSFRIVQKIYNKKNSNEFDSIFINILLSNKTNTIDIQKELKHIVTLQKKFTNKQDKYFLLHSEIILKYHQKIIDVKLDIKNLDLDNKLLVFDKIFKDYSQNEIKNAQLLVVLLIAMLFILIFVYLIYEKRLNNVNKSLVKFRSTLENSDSIVMITDKHENIIYVNEAFEKITKYSKEEVLGEKPSILKSGEQNFDFYLSIKNVIHSGKKWNGQFINKDKYGNIFYEKASITPSFDENGNIEEFICIKLDITKEILIQEELKKKENLLVEQSKLSAMGEMIGNIAHQWRQPLSVILSGSTAIQMQSELDVLNKEYIEKTCENINNNAQYLSKTIDDFRNFIKGDKNKEYFSLKANMKTFLNLIDPNIKNNNINLILQCKENIEINSYSNELNQCLLNIVNNSIDVIKSQNKKKDKYIFISAIKNNKNVIIYIKDSANGIPEKIMDKIFEPYFTTKHKSIGTGLGLSMTRNIIINSLNGEIEVKNVEYIYNDIKLKGALFTITLPLLNKYNANIQKY